jgi:hypothetical protein
MPGDTSTGLPVGATVVICSGADDSDAIAVGDGTGEGEVGAAGGVGGAGGAAAAATGPELSVNVVALPLEFVTVTCARRY